MKLIYNSNEWDIKRSRQDVAPAGFLFNFTFLDNTLNLETLASNLNGIQNGFTFNNETFTGYYIQSLAKDEFEEEGIVYTNIVLSLLKPYQAQEAING